MRRETVSTFLARAMLSLFLLLCGAVLILCATGGTLLLLSVVLGAVLLAVMAAVLPPAARALARLGDGKALALLCVLCLAVKSAVILYVRLAPAEDYATFWTYANAFARTPFLDGSRYIALFPHIFGYSSFLSWFIRLFGPGELLAQAVNVGLSVFSGAMLFLLGRRLLCPEAGAAACLLWIFCPSQTLYNCLVLSEPLYTAMLLAFLALIAELEARAEAFRRPEAAGVLAGLAGGLLLRWCNGVRPIAVILVVAMFLWVFLLKPRGGGRLWLPLLLCLTAAYFLTGPLWNSWVNARIGEAAATVPGYNIAVGFNARSGGQWNQADSDLLFSFSAQPGATAQWAQEQMLAVAKERAASGIDFPALFLKKLRAFLGADHSCVLYCSSALRHPRELSLLCSGCWTMLAGAAAWGGVWLFRRKDRSCALLLPLFALGLTLAQMLVEVTGRYHYSILPVFMLTGASALFRPDPPGRPRP